MFGFGRKRYDDDDDNDGGGPRPSRKTLRSLNYDVSAKHAVRIGKMWVDARALKAWLDRGAMKHLHTGVPFTPRDQEKIRIRAGPNPRRSNAYQEGLAEYARLRKGKDRSGLSRHETGGRRSYRDSPTHRNLAPVTTFKRECERAGGSHVTRRCRFVYELTLPETAYRNRNFVNVSTECNQRGKCSPYRVIGSGRARSMRSPV